MQIVLGRERYDRFPGQVELSSLRVDEHSGLYTATARATRPVYPSDQLRQGQLGARLVLGSATDEDASAAALRAQMEVVERYSGLVARQVLSMTYTSGLQLESPTFPSETLARHSKLEPGYVDGTVSMFSLRDRMPWIRSESSAGDSFVPAVMVADTPPQYEAERFWCPISTGSSAHFDRTIAARHAVFEVIERDAFSLSWLMGSGRVIEDAFEYRSDSMANSAVFVDVSSDLRIPVVACCLGSAEVPYWTLGCAARPTLADAIVASFAEAIQFRPALREMLQSGLRPPKRFQGARRVFDGALAGAVDPSPISEWLSNLTGGSDPEERVDDPLGRLRSLGHEVYVVDMTPTMFSGLGVHVLRTVVPSLLPMSPSWGSRYLDADRLKRTRAPTGQLLERPPYPLA